MAGAHTVPTATIVPELPSLDGVSEVESERPQNAKFGYGPHVKAQPGNREQDDREPVMSGGNPIGTVTGKR
jgi:hypothetical protein